MEERIAKLIAHLVCTGQITRREDLEEANEIYDILKSKKVKGGK